MALTMGLVLAACQPAGPYEPPRFGFAGDYRAGSRAVPVLLANSAWWERLGDPVLNRLVAEALRGSPSIAAAQARIAQAQAAFAATPGAVSVTSRLGASLEGSTGSGSSSTGGTADLGFSWLFDPYGARRAERAAAGARITVAEAETDAARLALIRAMATAYVELRYSQRRLALHEQEMRSRRQTLALTRTLFAAQAATRLDIVRSEGRMAEIEAELPLRRAAIRARQNEIAVLAGAAPGSGGGGLGRLGLDLDLRGDQPRPALSPEVGIPADLLRNRPDIRIAERRYYIAIADLGQARAALYPRLSLVGTLTAAGRQGGGSGGSEYFFGPALQLPALPAAQARAQVEGAGARVAEAHAIWKSTVLSALLEVENALIDYSATSTSAQASDKAVRLYREALDLTRKVFERGDATLGDLIDAEQALAGAEQTRADMRLRWGQSFIDLNTRLGAGHGAPGSERARPNAAGTTAIAAP